jgi:C_GCAxxG_C_C family probable redox protein
VGGHLWGKVDDSLLRASTGLGGGVGGCQQELCGALSGGVLVIGGVYGRTSVDEDDTLCYELVCAFRDRFAEAFGTTRCVEIRDSGYGGDGPWPCSAAVERATRILLEVLNAGAPARSGAPD